MKSNYFRLRRLRQLLSAIRAVQATLAASRNPLARIGVRYSKARKAVLKQGERYDRIKREDDEFSWESLYLGGVSPLDLVNELATSLKQRSEEWDTFADEVTAEIKKLSRRKSS